MMAAAFTVCLSLGGMGGNKHFANAVQIQVVHAQATPDHDTIINVLMAMKRDINKMLIIVHKHKAGTVDVAEEQVTLSAEQLTQLINKYNALKASLVAHYGELP